MISFTFNKMHKLKQAHDDTFKVLQFLFTLTIPFIAIFDY